MKTVSRSCALTDCRPVSLISLQTVRQVEEELGRPVDKRRFRSNVYLNLTSERGFAEDELVGRRIVVINRPDFGHSPLARVLIAFNLETVAQPAPLGSDGRQTIKPLPSASLTASDLGWTCSLS